MGGSKNCKRLHRGSTSIVAFLIVSNHGFMPLSHRTLLAIRLQCDGNAMTTRYTYLS